MKLLIIVLCLLSERFLIHGFSSSRFNWYAKYFRSVQDLNKRFPLLNQPWFLLAVSMVFPLLLSLIVLTVFSALFFGFLGFILNVVILFYCLGPDNPFYPVRSQNNEGTEAVIADYFISVNTQLFAPIFFYLFLGPLALIFYRLCFLSCQENSVLNQAKYLFDILNWLPVRLLALLFLFVGHFQTGFHLLKTSILAKPSENNQLLSQCALSALKEDEHALELSEAERMVEHALIVLLAFLAFSTLIAWV